MINFQYMHRRSWISLACAGSWGALLPRGASAAASSPRIRSLIWLYLKGGISHLESFDPKPDGDADSRGEFSAIDTSIPDVRFCELLPRTAKIADQFVVIRGVFHNLADHTLGRSYFLSGNRPSQVIEYPSIGSVCNKELTAPPGIPHAVGIPENYSGAGYLGLEYNPLATGAYPQIGNPFTLRGLSLEGGKAETYRRRTGLLKKIDTAFDRPHYDNKLIKGLDRFSREAEEMLTNPAVAEAFDIGRESAATTQLFGRSDYDAGCLLAARLVESGVRCVTVFADGWDTHSDHFATMKKQLLPRLDSCLPGLIAVLKAKDLWETTAVAVAGEFGRTPKINANAGRDHWPRCTSMLLAGGMFKPGIVFGSSDKDGAFASGRDITPPDVVATLYSGLGIDYRQENQLTAIQKIPLMQEGSPLDELFA
ncbi:MAG: DUF1501 domain-containing protein [Planctomycetaceae bacterium]